jgi:hypothetical protein
VLQSPSPAPAEHATTANAPEAAPGGRSKAHAQRKPRATQQAAEPPPSGGKSKGANY